MVNFLTAIGAVPNKTTPYDLEQMLQQPQQMKWYLVPIFVIVVYIIVTELKNKNYNVLMGAAAFWLMDVFNETWNSMVYATTGQPVWGTVSAGGSALQILVGYNIEISFMFFILGIVSCKMLKSSATAEGNGFWEGNSGWLDDRNNMYYKATTPLSKLTEAERAAKKRAVLGRVIPALLGSVLAVLVEIYLNHCGVLTWEKSWWQPTMPIILFLIGYCPFFFSAVIVHDLPRKKQLLVLGCILAVVVLLLIIAGSLGMLGPQTDGSGVWTGRWLKN